MPVRVFYPPHLRAARERAGYSREKLAFAVGCSSSSIFQYERGTITPSVAMLAALAQALDVDPGDLFDDDGSDTAEQQAVVS